MFDLVFFPLQFIIGLFSFFALNPFSWLYAVVLALIFFVGKKVLPLVKRKTFYATLAGSQLLLWVSLFVSKVALPYSDPWKEPAAKGGFPFTSFYYPQPPLGGDIPPLAQWPGFYLNFVVWFVAAALMVILWSRRKELKLQTVHSALFVAFCVSLVGLGYVAWQFD